jgi:hypothetical protein
MKARKPKKREIALIFVLFLAVVYTLSLDAKLKRTKQRNRAASEAVQNPVQIARPPVDKGGEEWTGVQSAEIAPYWGLDPFDRPFTKTLEASSEGKETPITEAELRLNGLVLTSRGASALISGQACSTGDTLLYYVVESIMRDRVILRNIFDGSTRTLKVE